MIPLTIRIDAKELFDAIIGGTAPHQTLPEGGDLELITKHGGAKSGRAIVMMTWTVEVDGKMRRVQCVTSVKLLKQALRVIDAKYTDEGWPRN